MYKGKVIEAYSYSSGRMTVSVLTIDTEGGVKKAGSGDCFKEIDKLHSGNNVLVYYEKLSKFQNSDGRIVWHIVMNEKVLCDYSQNVRKARMKFEREKYIAIIVFITGFIMIGIKLFRGRARD